MPRKFLNKFLPDRETLHAKLHGKWYMRPFDQMLHEPALWHIGRRSTSQALALGAFIACLPIPGHTVLAVLGALAWRINMPVALVAIWINNPLTIIPIYWSGYILGLHMLGRHVQRMPSQITLDWLLGELRRNSMPFWLGCLTEGLVFAFVAYFTLDLAWRLSIRGRWKMRQTERHERNP